MDNGTYETVFAKLPKYIQVNCSYTYIGKRLPSATQKHFDVPWVAAEAYQPGVLDKFLDVLNTGGGLYAAGLTSDVLGRDSVAIAQQAVDDNPHLLESDEEFWANDDNFET